MVTIGYFYYLLNFLLPIKFYKQCFLLIFMKKGKRRGKLVGVSFIVIVVFIAMFLSLSFMASFSVKKGVIEDKGVTGNLYSVLESPVEAFRQLFLIVVVPEDVCYKLTPCIDSPADAIKCESDLTVKLTDENSITNVVERVRDRTHWVKDEKNLLTAEISPGIWTIKGSKDGRDILLEAPIDLTCPPAELVDFKERGTRAEIFPEKGGIPYYCGYSEPIYSMNQELAPYADGGEKDDKTIKVRSGFKQEEHLYSMIKEVDMNDEEESSKCKHASRVEILEEGYGCDNFDYYGCRHNCPEEMELLAEFKGEVDIDGLISLKELSNGEIQERSVNFFNENPDISLYFKVSTPKRPVTEAEETDSPEKKMDCHLPEYFDVQVKAAAWYYEIDIAVKREYPIYQFITGGPGIGRNSVFMKPTFIKENVAVLFEEAGVNRDEDPNNDVDVDDYMFNHGFFKNPRTDDRETEEGVQGYPLILSINGKDDRALIEETLSLRISYHHKGTDDLSDDEIQLDVRDEVEVSEYGSHYNDYLVNEEDTDNDNLGKVKLSQKLPVSDENAPPIILTRGSSSRQIYDNLLTELSREIPNLLEETEIEIEGEDGKKSKKTLRLLTEEGVMDTFNQFAPNGLVDTQEKLFQKAHVIPKVEINTLSNLRDYTDVIRYCCKRNPKISEIPSTEPDRSCSKAGRFGNYFGKIQVPMDITIFQGDEAYDILNDRRYFPDAKVESTLNFESVDYDFYESGGSVLRNNFRCGYPKAVNLKLEVIGYAHDYAWPYGQVDTFSKVRKEALVEFPPAEIKHLFTRSGRPLDQYEQSDIEYFLDQVVDVINGLFGSDDSVRVNEEFEVRIEYVDGATPSQDKITMSFLDRLIFTPLDGYGIYANDYFEKIQTKGTNEIVLSQGVVTPIIYAMLVDKMVNQMYQMRNNPRFRITTERDVGDPGSGRYARTVPDLRYDFTGRTNRDPNPNYAYSETFGLEKWKHNQNNKDCCPFKKRSWPAYGVGFSVYMLRDKDNFEYPGIAYVATADKDIDIEVTKRFIDFDENNYDMYRLEDEELLFCDYDILEEIDHFVGTGLFLSSDGEFELGFNEDPSANINIKTIDISECGILNLDNLEVSSKDQACRGDFNTDGKVDSLDKDFFSLFFIPPCNSNEDWCSGSDVNQDGSVNRVDVADFIRYLGSTDCSLNNDCNHADIDKDGKAGLIDLLLIKRNLGREDCGVCVQETVELVDNCDESNNWCDYRDFNIDGFVDGSDFIFFDSDMGRTDCNLDVKYFCRADLNQDGRIDYDDLDLVFLGDSIDCLEDNNWCSGKDLNQNGFFDVFDDSFFNRAFGVTGCPVGSPVSSSAEDFILDSKVSEDEALGDSGGSPKKEDLEGGGGSEIITEEDEINEILQEIESEETRDLTIDINKTVKENKTIAIIVFVVLLMVVLILSLKLLHRASKKDSLKKKSFKKDNFRNNSFRNNNFGNKSKFK